MWVYMIKCKDKKENMTFYTGISKDYLNRWEQHWKGIGALYTKLCPPIQPVFLMEVETFREACVQERLIKKLSHKNKIELIDSDKNILKNEPDKPMKDWFKTGKQRVPIWEVKK